MEIIHERSAGLDVHKKTVVASRHNGKGYETQTFGTTTGALLTLLDWLQKHEITHVAMESTGEYWKPVHNILEGNVEVWLVNAQHVKTVPGRKTDVKDAEWLAQLMRYGLVRASFIPPQGQRDLRDLTRQRSNLVSERAREVNRMQKVLEGANIKLASVASDVTGVSARDMLSEIIAGNENAEALANLARGVMRKKITELTAALTGRVRAHHRFMLSQHLAHIDELEERIAAFEAEIETYMSQLPAPPAGDGGTAAPAPIAEHAAPPSEANAVSPATMPKPDPKGMNFEAACKLLDAIPGISKISGQHLLAEIGTDMTRFPSQRHLSAWAGVAPGNKQSGGKRLSGQIPSGYRPVRQILIEIAQAAARCKNSYFSQMHQRIMLKRGKKRALIAVAHAIVETVYHMLKNGTAYKEHVPATLDKTQGERTTQHLVKRLEKLGHKVILSTATT